MKFSSSIVITIAMVAKFSTVSASSFSSSSSSNFLRGTTSITGTHKKIPTDPNAILPEIEDYLWNHKFPGVTTNGKILFKGSYPAALHAYGSDGTVFPYNDIDIFVEEPVETERCRQVKQDKTMDASKYFTESEYFYLRSTGEQVQVSVLCELEPQSNVESAEISAVAIGFTAEATNDGEPAKRLRKQTRQQQHQHSIGWIVTEEFENFMDTKTLEIIDSDHITKSPSSLIRIIRKAKELGVGYRLPTEERMIDLVYGAPFTQHWKDVFDDNLSTEEQQVLLDLFDIVPIQQSKSQQYTSAHGQWYLFAPKLSLPSARRYLWSFFLNERIPNNSTGYDTINISFFNNTYPTISTNTTNNVIYRGNSYSTLSALRFGWNGNDRRALYFWNSYENMAVSSSSSLSSTATGMSRYETTSIQSYAGIDASNSGVGRGPSSSDATSIILHTTTAAITAAAGFGSMLLLV